MITGLPSLFLDFCFYFFLPSIFILNLLVAKNHKLRRKLRQETLPPVLSIFFLVLSLIMPFFLFYKVVGYVTLKTLNPSQVASITVNDHTFANQDDITKIVSSINRLGWATGVGKPKGHFGSMNIISLSGKKRYFMIIFYDESTSIGLEEETDNLAGPEAVVPELSNVLLELGVK